MRAPAKLNLGLFVGPTRTDGLHEIASLFCALELADRVVATPAEADEVVCPGVEGPNLAEDALRELRQAGWDAPPVRVEIEKRVPVAAGLGGGSADAAAVLRLADGLDVGAIAARLGADVTSQLEPGFAFVAGAGEEVEPLPEPGQFGVVLVPFERGLSAGEVYAQADRMGIGRNADELEGAGGELRRAALAGESPLAYADLLVNDLEAAVLALRPEVVEALDALREAGAVAARVTGSGPTAFGLFPDIVAADRASSALPHRWANALVSAPARGLKGSAP